MKKFKESDWKRWLFFFSIGAALVVVYKSFGNLSEVFALVGSLGSILVPFIIAFAIAYFLSRPVNFFDRLFGKINVTNPRLKFLNFFGRKSRVFSIIIVYILFIGLLTLLVYAIAPELISGIVGLWNNAESYFDTAEGFLDSLEDTYPAFAGLNLGDIVLGWAEGIIKSIDITTVVGTIQSVTSVGSTIVNIILSIFVSIYMLAEKDVLIAALRRIFSLFCKEETLVSIGNYLRRADKVVYTYFTAQFLDCVIVSVFATIVLAILNAPSPMVLGFIFGMMNIIPYFGPIIGGVVVVFIILVTRGFMLAFWSALILLALQQLDANVLNPRILGTSLDMSPFWVIFAITVGSGLFGFGGMLLGVPTIAVLRMIYRDLLKLRRKRVAERQAAEPALAAAEADADGAGK